VGNKISQHDTDSQNIGRHNRMLPMCRADIRDMSATDKNVCRFGWWSQQTQIPTLPAKLDLDGWGMPKTGECFGNIPGHQGVDFLALVIPFYGKSTVLLPLPFA
jgi:hypothetical protein